MEEIDIKELFYFTLKKKFYIILSVILGIVLALLYTKFLVTPLYSSYTTLVLSKSNTSTSMNDLSSQEYLNSLSQDNTSITQNDISITQKLLSTYCSIIKSRAVASQVKENLGLAIPEEEIISKISLTSSDDSNMLKIEVKNEDPSLAMNIANSLAEVFIVKVNEIYDLQNLIVIDRAFESTSPCNINFIKNCSLGAALGLFISCGIIFLAFYFDTRIRSKGEVEELLNLEILAIIPDMDN